MEKHFVTFFNPGSFVSETSTEDIGLWDVSQAQSMAEEIKERYGAKPYGFQFTTRTRGDNDFDSKESDKSPMYYLGGEVLTLEEVEAKNDPNDKILISNMKRNGYERIIINNNSWKFTGVLEKEDIILAA